MVCIIIFHCVTVQTENWHFVCSQGHKYVFEMEDAEKEKQKNNAHH